MGGLGLLDEEARMFGVGVPPVSAPSDQPSTQPPLSSHNHNNNNVRNGSSSSSSSFHPSSSTSSSTSTSASTGAGMGLNSISNVPAVNKLPVNRLSLAAPESSPTPSPSKRTFVIPPHRCDLALVTQP